MEQLIKDFSNNVDGQTIAAVTMVAIICMVAFADKMPISKQDTKGSTLILMLFGLFGFMFIVCN